MKKLFWLVYYFALNATVFAQKGQHALGITLSSSIATQGLGNSETGEFQVPISPSGGVYYDWNFSRKIGLNMGANFRIETQRVTGFCFNCFGSGQFKYIYQTVEFPVNLAINLNGKETADVKMYFLAGYTYSYLLSFVGKDLQYDVEYDYMEQFGVLRNNHFLNLAFEGRHNIKDKYTVGFSPFARILLSQPLEGGTSYVGLALKFGRII